MLTAAVAAAKTAGAELVIHCGDLIGAMTLRPLLQLGLPVHVVHGNNQGDPVALWNLCSASAGLITYHGPDVDLQLAGCRLFATHYPHYARGLACTGDYDVVCCGHSHEASVLQQPGLGGTTTWLVNPGSVAGLGAPATWLLADLANFDFQIQALN
jgi:putative phosphoesterase